MKQFHIITTGRNVFNYIETNINGLKAQSYTNWRCTIIDDASNDDTLNVISQLIDDRFVLISNECQKGALVNRHTAITKYSQPDDIIVFWDADDYYAHNYALDRIAQEYKDPNCYVTYGHFMCWPSKKTLWNGDYPSYVHKHREYRTVPLFAGHPQTFKVELYNHIKPEDLLDDNGKPWEVASDLIVMVPILEMAGKEHVRHIPDILYLYQNERLECEHFTQHNEQMQTIKNFMARKKYDTIILN